MTATTRPRVLLLVTRDDIGGVRVLTDMIGEGLAGAGCDVKTRALIGGSGVGRLVHLAGVARDLLSGGYDAVFSFHAAASVVAGLIGSIARVPVHAAHLTAIPSAIRPHWRLVDRLIGTMGGHTHIVANSRATEAAFAGYPTAYRDRMIAIPHAVSPLPVKGETDWRSRLDIKAGAPLLVASGRLTDQKGFATAIGALAHLPQAHLAIAGDGPLRDQLVALAESLGVAGRLHLPGTLPRDALGDFLSSGDVYLFPSLWETFGLAGAEALMVGLPVVAADLPVLRQVLGEAGAEEGMVRFANASDPADFACAISETLADRPLPAVRQRSAAAATGTYAVSRMIKDYMALITRA